MDPERLRYFTQSVEGRPSTRHRRRRADGTAGPAPATTPAPNRSSAPASPGAAPTGSAPTSMRARVARTDTIDTTIDTRKMAPVATPTVDEAAVTDLRKRPEPSSEVIEQPVTEQPVTEQPVIEQSVTDATPTAPPGEDVDADQVGTEQTEQTEPSDLDGFGTDEVPTETVDPTSVAPTSRVVAPGALAALADPTVSDEGGSGFADTAAHDTVIAHDTADHRTAADTVVADTGGAPVDDHPDRRPAGIRRRRRRRIGMIVAAVVVLLLVVGVGLVGAKKAGLLDSRKDYTNAQGTGDVLVHIPDDTTIKQMGQILVDDDVVGSVHAFVDAAGDASLSSGYYKMRTEIPASTAVEMISDPDATHRVGRIVVPPGTPVDTKRDTSGRVTPGIFEMIANQTGVDINGQRIGVTVEQLDDAAAQASVADLGIPSWARDAVTGLDGDHRRIEGLIAPGTWESIDPGQSATEILRSLITQSAAMYEKWGLLSNNSSGLSPYQTLVAASLLQGEVNPADYPKVARVILNRLDKGQKLEFDSTANYTAQVVDLNVHDEDLRAGTPWNTYVIRGLPPTPIGAVEEQALEAMEQPADGNWLYFVTVDAKGTTLFTADFDQHRRNISTACRNRFITCR
ncbi:endolytic transglycosylase MltG [Gordonia sp. VNQ95]|uniref:endolytic transglycosylase MltG n=1 Tax=Gordonia sp. VNQ95 TaxID=3156619 RepID=UPI0032B491BE